VTEINYGLDPHLAFERHAKRGEKSDSGWGEQGSETESCQNLEQGCLTRSVPVGTLRVRQLLPNARLN